jgi:hypothetical protein
MSEESKSTNPSASQDSSTEEGIDQRISEQHPAENSDASAVIDLWENPARTTSEASPEASEEKKEPDQSDKNEATASEPAEKKEATASEQLVAALGRFVKEQSATARQQEEAGKFTFWQIAAFLLVTCDLVLAYMSLPSDFLAVPVVKFATSLIPWLLGASAFAYAEKLRGWLLKRCDNRYTAGSALLVFAVLLPMRFPLFSINVKLRPLTKLLVNGGDGKQFEKTPDLANTVRIGPTGLKNYDVTVADGDMNVRNAKPLQLNIGRWQLLKSTLAQIPLIGHALGSDSMDLTPLYGINVKSSSGLQYVEVAGSFPPGFVESRGYGNEKRKDGKDVVRIPIMLRGLCRVDLPYGTYDFRVHQQDCWKEQKGLTVQGSGELFSKIDFDKMDCSTAN